MSRRKAASDKATRGGKSSAATPAAPPPRVAADDLEPIVEKLKLLEFGLYGLQVSGRVTAVDIEDLGPFVRLAEEIGSDVEALRARLAAPPATPRVRAE